MTLSFDMPFGSFIGLEGFEGAGKTTVARNLCKRLNNAGHAAEIGREPGTTAIGEAIRDILKRDWDPEDSMCASTEALLFLSARAQFIRQFVRPRLECGIHVIADRFALCCVVPDPEQEQQIIGGIHALPALAPGALPQQVGVLLGIAAQGGCRQLEPFARFPGAV